LNGLSYMGVLWGLFRMQVPPFQRSAVPPGSAITNILAGLRHIARDARMRTLVILIGILTVFGAPFLVLLPIVARDVLGRGAGTYGWMMAAVGAGALAGALWIAGPARRLPRGRIVVWSSTGFGLLVTALGAARSLPVALPLLAVTGCAMIVNGAIVNTLLQLLAPEELRGRVISVYTLVAVGFAPLGAVEAGTIAEHFGAPTALVVGGLICVVGALITLLRTPELKQTR
jgi:predicted MFS family arabinose efflux permease